MVVKVRVKASEIVIIELYNKLLLLLDKITLVLLFTLLLTSLIRVNV